MNRLCISIIRSTALGLIFALAGGCGANPTETSPDAVPPGPESVLVRLEECPAEDAPWESALKAAESAGELDAFLVRTETLADTCSELWTPRWAAGDALYRMRKRETLLQAREHYSAALELAAASNSAVGIARCSNRLAGYLVRERNYADAERLYREGLQAARDAGRTDLEAFMLNNLARVARETGRFAEAVDALQRAQPLLREHRLDSSALSAGYNESVMLLDLGNTAEARDRLEEIFTAASAGKNERIMASSSVALGNLHRLQNRLDSASVWFERVPVDSSRRPFADLGLARIALAQNDDDLAEQHLAAIRLEQTTVGHMARVLEVEISLRRGDSLGAVSMAERIVKEAESTGGGAAVFTSRAMLGKCLLAIPGREAAAVGELRLAVENIEKQSEGLSIAQEGVAYLRERSEPYADLAAALALTGAETSAVFDTVERAHARSLRRVLGGPQHIEGSTLHAVQAALGQHELLVTYLVGMDRGTVVALDREQAVAFPIEGWSTLRPMINELRRSMIRLVARTSIEPDTERTAEIGARLREVLLGPFEEMIAETERLLIVPDQDLALVPFAALPRRQGGEWEYLAQSVEIGMLPMAGRAPDWAEPRLPLLLAGNPLPDAAGEFEALPTTKQEIAGIAAVWKRDADFSLLPSGCVGEASVVKLQRGRLTASTLRRAGLSSFNTIHLATHAVASSLDPRRCAVILSNGERLSMNEIAELELGAALVVLSACRTGEGEIVPGEGVVGLTWAFLHAGAKAVAASLWSVEDEATAALMLAFHRYLSEGADPVSAMARAQRERMRVQPHPAFWSPFVVVLKPQSR